MNQLQNKMNNIVIKGNCILNLRIIIFIVINVVYFSIVTKDGEPFDFKLIIFVLVFDILFFLLSAASLFYFVFDDKKLVIKNCWYFWYKNDIEINSIRKIIIDSVLKAGTGIRIITDNKKVFFACNFIRDKDLAFLAKLLTEKGIDVEINIDSIRDEFLELG